MLLLYFKMFFLTEQHPSLHNKAFNRLSTDNDYKKKYIEFTENKRLSKLIKALVISNDVHLYIGYEKQYMWAKDLKVFLITVIENSKIW